VDPAAAGLPFGIRLAAGVALGVVLVGTTLAFGGVQPWAWGGALALLAVACGAVLATTITQEHALGVPKAALVPALGLAALLVVLQLVPLPLGVVSSVSAPTADLTAARLPEATSATLSVAWPDTVEALLKGLSYGLAFLLAAALCRDPRYARALLLALLGLGAFEAFYGVIQQFGGEARIFAWEKPTGAGRASGTYVNPNHYAGFLAFAIPAGLGLAAATGARHGPLPRPWRQRLTVVVTDPEFPKRVLLVFAPLIVAVGVVASLSRGAALAAPFGVLALVLVTRRERAFARRGRNAALVLAGAILLWFSVVGAEQLLARMERVPEQTLGPTLGGRLGYVRDTWAMATDHPLTGIGAGAFASRFPAYQQADSGSRYVNHAHSDYVELLAELGFVGGGLLLLGIGITGVQVWRRIARNQDETHAHLGATALACLAPLAVHSLVDFNLRIPANALWASALLGAAWAGGGADAFLRVSLPRSRALHWAAVVGAAIPLAWGSWVALTWAQADWTAAPFVERARGDDRPRQIQIHGLEEALERWPYRDDHLVRLAQLRQEHLYEGLAEQAALAARAVVDPEETLDVQTGAVAAAIANARLARDPGVVAETEACLGLVRRAVALAPAEARWAEYEAALRARLESLRSLQDDGSRDDGGDSAPADEAPAGAEDPSSQPAPPEQPGGDRVGRGARPIDDRGAREERGADDRARSTTVPSDVDAEERQSLGRAKRLLEEWVAAGTAAGYAGLVYENRDRGHSDLNLTKLPGLRRAATQGYGPSLEVHEEITFGNSSTASPHASLGSHVRTLYASGRHLERLHEQYRGNTIYVYPEHRDHDPGVGDLMPTNTPYLIGSQGSSGSDRAFLEAIAVTLGALRPRVRERLAAEGLLMPTLQWILRRSYVRSEEAYLTGEAHPTVFRGDRLRFVAMARRAQALSEETVPPLVRLRVLDEAPGPDREARNYIDPLPERLVETDSVVARVWRGFHAEWRVAVDASESVGLAGRPLSFRWVVLRGDPDRVRVGTRRPDGSLAEIVAAYPERRQPRSGGPVSSRIDVGCFAHDGHHWSAPGFVTVYGLPEEERRYSADGRLLEITYRTDVVVDPRLSGLKGWTDTYRYDEEGRLLGWTRQSGTTQRAFTRHGFLVGEVDEDGRPAVGYPVTYSYREDPSRKLLWVETTPDFDQREVLEGER